MLKDFTRNLFYFFRGPTSDDSAMRDRQLENNLTKSLIVVLEHADNVFLQAFARQLDLAPPDGSLRFSLQRRPVGAHRQPNRVVLGITGGRRQPIESCGVADSGRPDAWILTDQWAVLVESKVGQKIATDQLRAHAESAGWGTKYELRYLTWGQIYSVFRDELAGLGDRVSPTTHLLVSHWLDYLRGQQMIPFEKLESDDFDYFNLPKDEQRHLMANMRSRLEEFQRQLARTSAAAGILDRCGLSRAEAWKHGTLRAGDRQAWFNVGGGNLAGRWHATVFFRAHGVDVEVLGTSKKLTRRFAGAGDGTVLPKVLELVRRCADSSDSPSIAVACRRAWFADPSSGFKGQRIKSTDEPLMGHPRILIKSTREQFAGVLLGLLATSDRRYRTEVIIRYSIPREQLTDGDLSAQVGHVAEALSRMRSPLEFLLSS